MAKPIVAVVGRPNVGKSTLMNYLIGQKIAITSNKPQTTRNRIQTVLTTEEGQVVFVDTPGIHKAKNKLGEYMVNVAERTLNEVDVVLWLVEPTTFIGAGEKHIAEQLGKNIKTYCPDVKHVVIIFNPADLTGLVTLLYSGLKPGQVTTLAGLDTTRLKSALAKKFGVMQSEIEGCATYGVTASRWQYSAAQLRSLAASSLTSSALRSSPQRSGSR